jgi:membrane protease YdiL (CAAX protease family)
MPARAAAGPRNLLTSLVLVTPLWLVYQVGVLFTLPMLNGADFLTVLLFQHLGLTTTAYLGFVGGVAVALLGSIALLRRRQRFNAGMIVPVLLESTIYALSMGTLIVLVMTKLLHISPRLAAGIESQSAISRFVMSVGAGVYEETVFRLGLMTGLAVLLERVFGAARWLSVAAALLVSSIAFSAVHHIPPYGDPLSLGVFTFRTLAGVFFGLLFAFRGYAVAVYTHAIYDVYVLLLR